MTWWTALDATAKRIVGFMALACVLALILFALSVCNARQDAAKARGEGRVADAQAGLGADAMRRADELNEADRLGQVQTDKNTDFITGADNANDPAGEAGDRGRLAYCERQRLRQRPEPHYCASLRRAYPAKP